MKTREYGNKIVSERTFSRELYSINSTSTCVLTECVFISLFIVCARFGVWVTTTEKSWELSRPKDHKEMQS